MFLSSISFTAFSFCTKQLRVILHAFIHWWWWLPCKELSSKLQQGQFLTCRPGELNQWPSTYKMLALPLSHSHCIYQYFHIGNCVTCWTRIQAGISAFQCGNNPSCLHIRSLISMSFVSSFFACTGTWTAKSTLFPCPSSHGWSCNVSCSL